ncbi:dTDP-4-amino-4,6-dideoxy-D-galactose acyltransferase [Enterobacter sp. CC120223-11]|uniref:dTDP-4-amino-4,6-dideoxy-D-galactose acyltransferase n=1 Tax=Enterobacter sp. CC120223-11 TaxID=1378073 RepID=UPI000BC696BC|nr:dTDP-4-amino-4,6-dideoxy-D-galactose acyltransferase [Enterobacter sp. CC120223-11]SNY78281.1 dTDP-4-amino-4,6-dideoxy-D-galactose acyltransferase [Enterobacter sp. CC120223-11]
MPVRASINPLKWESEFFGIDSAILHISDDAPELRAEALANFPRVQVKIPAQQTDWLDALQQLGFQLVEGEVDFKLEVTDGTDPQAERATEQDIPRLRELAAQAFSQSRFRAPWYDADASGRFYAQWIENAVRGTFDHECLIFRDDSADIRAFVSLRQLNDGEARIGLLAGRGAGEILMQAAARWAYSRQLTTLRVSTQMGNTAALNRYIQSGASLESTAYWLYR